MTLEQHREEVKSAASLAGWQLAEYYQSYEKALIDVEDGIVDKTLMDYLNDETSETFQLRSRGYWDGHNWDKPDRHFGPNRTLRMVVVMPPGQIGSRRKILLHNPWNGQTEGALEVQYENDPSVDQWSWTKGSYLFLSNEDRSTLWSEVVNHQVLADDVVTAFNKLRTRNNWDAVLTVSKS